ncbi:MAG: metalloregulator ArsR/SmtB family transcription factor [Ardenticatenaceae bacterium]|nr:metalloregulator ArsR/SmtB family transcription factor [Ardenticatenaceae bacterium]MCB9445545.1 metalloregulator ArsR/SmtB family transcription factor [Ardenticatenaceae bacterium]
MAQEEFEKLLQFFKVLGNESRLKIMGLLANGERTVGELANLLGVKEPTISHHLAMMRELGLVDGRAEGNERIYRLETKFLETMSKDIFSQDNLATLVDDQEANKWEKKVLQTFVENGRITAIPSRYKKRQVILNWLVEKFERDRRYTEAELSEMLQAYHEDYAALRRYFIETGLMAREKGIYWRI